MFVTTIDYGMPAYDEVVALRYRVLRQPLGLEFEPEDLAKEHCDIHFALYDNSHNLLACMLLRKDAEDEGIAWMRQVAVEPRLQGKGLGTKLADTFERYAKEHNYREIQLEARETALNFYEKLGYKKVGKSFQKLGVPHYLMKKRLKGLSGVEPDTELWYEENKGE